MPQALFFNVPGHGHINPTLPLVAELARRGHQINYYASPAFRAGIEAAGAEFRETAAVGDDYFDARGLHGGVANRVAYHLQLTAEQILPGLIEFARAARPDYVLYDGMCPWGYYVARVLRVPAVVSYALMPPISPALSAMPVVLGAFAPVLFRDLGKRLDAVRRAQALARRYGIPALDFVSLFSAPGDLGLSYTSSYFQPFADTVPHFVRFVGWTLRETPVGDFSALERAQGRALVYVSLGTLNNDQPEFFRDCIAAFGGTDLFAVISTGRRVDPDAFGPLPDNVVVAPWVPQSEVLKRAALFITHGGLNSIHDGLYCGVPLLVVPQQEEQAFNARRVAELGAGLVLHGGEATRTALSAGVTRLLKEARFRSEAHRIGETLRTAGGAPRAADEVEDLLKKRRQ